MSLWCLLNAPLLLGCDLTQLDDFTRNLLTNDEVLAVNQDPLGQQAQRIAKQGTQEIWSKTMDDGSLVVGLFNRGELPVEIKVSWQQLGLQGPQRVRDLWRQKDVGVFADAFASSVGRHGVTLVRISSIVGSP
jgi:alpha-galactosidase